MLLLLIFSFVLFALLTWVVATANTEQQQRASPSAISIRGTLPVNGDEIIVCHVGTQPGDLHLFATVHCMTAKLLNGWPGASAASSALWICAGVAVGKQPELYGALSSPPAYPRPTRKRDRLVLSNRIHDLLEGERLNRPHIDHL